MRRVLVSAVLVLGVTLGGGLAPAEYRGGFPAAPAVGSYRPPVDGPVRVLRGFSPPSTPYGPGHLGVDLAFADGDPVLAAAAGLVRFAGQVADRGVLVIEHPDGISTEYEPLTPTVAAGASVVAGQPVGRLTGQHPGCPAASCLHWGARRNGQYVDPLSLLRPLGVVRLLPWDWTPSG
jgi:murein DD-endopeptidase MepM/ murein hydrolase activator NlpD